MTNDKTIKLMNNENPGERSPKTAALGLLMSLLMAVALLSSCSGAKLTLANYNKITTGMSKTQVEKILGPPTSVERTDMFIFKKTTYRYEDGKKFAIITFKNDEVDSKDTNLSANP